MAGGAVVGAAVFADVRGDGALGLSVAVLGRRRHGGGGGGARGADLLEVLDEDEDRGFTLCRAGTGAGVALDHALRREERLDLVTKLSDAVVLLETRDMVLAPNRRADVLSDRH